MPNLLCKPLRVIPFCLKVLGILIFSVFGLFFSLYSCGLFLELIFQTTMLNVPWFCLLKYFDRLRCISNIHGGGLYWILYFQTKRWQIRWSALSEKEESFCASYNKKRWMYELSVALNLYDWLLLSARTCCSGLGAEETCTGRLGSPFGGLGVYEEDCIEYDYIY